MTACISNVCFLNENEIKLVVALHFVGASSPDLNHHVHL